MSLTNRGLGLSLKRGIMSDVRLKESCWCYFHVVVGGKRTRSRHAADGCFHDRCTIRKELYNGRLLLQNAAGYVRLADKGEVTPFY